MSAAPEGPAAPGEPLVRELLLIHGLLRRDLEVVRGLAQAVERGAPAEQVREDVRTLESSSPIWRLRIGCLHYCRFVHGHHGLEDAAIFPALRGSSPRLGPVVDRLEAEHRRIADDCDEVLAAADALAAQAAGSRERVAAALNVLGDNLLAHLAFEEEGIIPTLRSWERWPTA